MTGIWIEVHTNKRSYAVCDMGRVDWLPGEKVISMAPVTAGSAR